MPPQVATIKKQNEEELHNKVTDQLQSSEEGESVESSSSKKKRMRQKQKKNRVGEGSGENKELEEEIEGQDQVENSDDTQETDDEGVLELQALESYSEVDDVVVYEEKDKQSDELSNLLVKPFLQTQSAKQKKHDEDKIIAVHYVWENTQKQVKVPFSVFGVCDGHGGKHASTTASKRLVYYVQQYLQRLPISDVLESDVEIDEAKDNFEDILGDLFSDEDLDEEESSLLKSVKMSWKVEDEMVKYLPSILHTAFLKVAEECKEECSKSGTTATLLVMVGWQVVVASVGDSYCYVDNSKQVKMVSSNHRVEDNLQERAAVIERGGEVAKEGDDEGKPVGPLRVWPGGLQMSRSLGDKASESVITPAPDIKLVTLPANGGRFVVASDGLWDAYKSNPKAAVQQIRGLPAGQAAPKLLVSGVKKVGLKDDISILVVDALKDERGVFGKGTSQENPAEVVVVDVDVESSMESLSKKHIWQVRKHLVQELRRKRKEEAQAAAAAAAAAKRVKEEEASVASTSRVISQKQSSSYEDLSNLKIDVETLQEDLNKTTTENEWQETKKNRSTSGGQRGGRGRGGRNFTYGNGRGRGRNSVSRNNSIEAGVLRAPVPSKHEFTATQIRERLDATSDPFAKFKVDNPTTTNETADKQSATNVGQLNRPNSGRVRRNTNVGNSYNSRVGNNRSNVIVRGSSTTNNNHQNRSQNTKDYIVKYSKPTEVVEVNRASSDVVAFQKKDVISVQRPRDVIEISKNSPKNAPKTFKKNEISKGAFVDENTRTQDAYVNYNSSDDIHAFSRNGNGRGRGRGQNRGGYGRGGNNTRPPRYSFQDVKTENKVNVS